MNRRRFWFLATLIFLAAASRLVPHSPNVTPPGGDRPLRGRHVRTTMVGATVASGGTAPDRPAPANRLLGGLAAEPGLLPGAMGRLLLLLAGGVLASLIHRRYKVLTVMATTLAGSLVFFLTTSFAFWASGLMYDGRKDCPKYMLCTGVALPFFRDSLIGGLDLSLSPFWVLALAEARIPAIRRSAAVDLALTPDQILDSLQE